MSFLNAMNKTSLTALMKLLSCCLVPPQRWAVWAMEICLGLLRAGSNSPEDFSWWLQHQWPLCCVNDLSWSVLPLGIASAKHYWPQVTTPNIWWTTADCISGYEIPSQQCKLGMLSMLQSFPFILLVEVLVTSHRNVLKEQRKGRRF